jgi:glycosyltransferase involved in cell wall biosynthesis
MTQSPVRTAIIIPAYNYEKYVTQSIESALAQDDTGVEVIVVDDGSTDRTGEIALMYADRGVRTIRKVNGGLPAARNTGIAATEAEFVFFLDADDIAEPSAIRRMRTTLEEKGPDFGLVACQPQTMSEDGTVRGVHCSVEGDDSQEVMTAEIIERSRFCTTVLARTAALRKAGLFDESLRGSEDRDMWIRLGASGARLWLLREVMVHIRIHDIQMSGNPRTQVPSREKMLRKAWAQRSAPRWPLSLWMRAWAIHHYQASSISWERGLHAMAWRHLLASLIKWPFSLAHAFPQDRTGFRWRRLAAWTVRTLTGRK